MIKLFVIVFSTFLYTSILSQNIHELFELDSDNQKITSLQNYDSLIRTYKEKYLYATTNNDTTNMLKSSIVLAELYKSCNIIDSSKQYIYNVLSLSYKTKNYQTLILSYISLGELVRSTYHSDIADKYIYSAIDISSRTKIYDYLPYAYNRLAAIYFEKFYNKNLPPDSSFLYKSIQFLDSSFYWSKKLNIQTYNTSNYNILGSCLSTQRKYDLSNYYLKKALTLAQIKNDYNNLPYIYKNLAENYYLTGKLDSAVIYALNSAKFANQYNIREAAWFSYDLLVKIFKYNNDYKNAFLYQLKKDSIEEINRMHNSDKKLKEFKAEYSTYQEKLLLRHQKIKIIYLELIIILSFIIICIVFIFIYLLIKQSKKIKQQNNTLLQKNEEIHRLNSFQIDLMNMIVHDLKNPLGIIINTSKDEYIQTLSKKMLSLTENILDVYKYQNTKLEINKTYFNICELIKEAINNHTFSLQQKNITTKLNCNGTITFADKDLIERVIYNLLSNAIKYNFHNGKINITVENTVNDKIIVTFKNTGNSIPEELIDNIFAMYNCSNNYSYNKSTGIGLAFCKLAIEAHGEKIIAKNEDDFIVFQFQLDCINNAISSKETSVYNNSKVVLTIQESKLLIPYISKLKNLNIFQTSELLNIINNIPDTSDNIIKWKQNIRQSIFSLNYEEYKNHIDF